MCKRILGFVMAALFFSSLREADAQQAILLVRHADTESDGTTLSEKGRERAKKLAGLLKDAKINVIFTSNAVRTIETAAPLAQALGIMSMVREEIGLSAANSKVFVDFLRKDHRNDIVLIVSHSTTIPALLNDLKHPTKITIQSREFDNVFILIPQTRDLEPTFLRLRY